MTGELEGSRQEVQRLHGELEEMRRRSRLSGQHEVEEVQAQLTSSRRELKALRQENDRLTGARLCIA